MSRKKLTKGILESNRVPRGKIMFQYPTKTKYYLSANFQKIWPMSKLSCFGIKKAKIVKVWKSFLYKNKHYIAIVLVPGFHIFTRSSSFFLVFCLHFSGSIFFWTGVIWWWWWWWCVMMMSPTDRFLFQQHIYVRKG